ncbi:MAG: 3-phosphoshikimate 1-carboxyvinyltransferase [Lachnospiraceae bacterium]|nr:3-phosphoshikimate 1-carboxyvinyltransferase [Lachnospiraceae bacterium]
MEKYKVKPLKNLGSFKVEVPGSKSITNRALLLAAMCTGRCTLKGVLFSDDSRAFLSCLKELGFELAVDEDNRTVTINGTGGKIPNRQACVNVGSAGTAARFLTVFLAFAGGSYRLDASPQMCRRPMEPLISTLRTVGVNITCSGEEGHFPFGLSSGGVSASGLSIDTDLSSQFASAILMAAPLLDNGLKVNLTGNRTNGSYIGITLKMMEQFGFGYERSGDVITVNGGCPRNPSGYTVEPDVSAACYFYAMSPLCNKTICVKNVHADSMQGDIKFVECLKMLGCTVEEPWEGITVIPPVSGKYDGIDINMQDFSDQTMTMAVLAAFAGSPSYIHGIGHIRLQESDRLNAIITELNRLGCACSAIEDYTGICIEPAPMHGADIETYEDHRMAMAFSLAGLRIPDVSILNPMCCRKTFEDYFDVLDSITGT